MKTQEEVVRQYAVGPIRIYKIYQEGYQDRELDDWAAFRREAAKDILAGFAAKIGHSMNDYSEQSCKYAIQLADEIIKQLKEK